MPQAGHVGEHDDARVVQWADYLARRAHAGHDHLGAAADDCAQVIGQARVAAVHDQVHPDRCRAAAGRGAGGHLLPDPVQPPLELAAVGGVVGREGTDHARRAGRGHQFGARDVGHRRGYGRQTQTLTPLRGEHH